VELSCAFTEKFSGSIIAVLGCFDRLIFKGYLPFGGDEHLNRYVDQTLQIPRKDFLPQVQTMSQQLVDHAQRMAEEAGAPYHYLQGKHSKEQLVQKIARERRHPEGLLAVLCCQENCRWLAREMLRHRLGFVQEDNAFTQLDDPQRAQRLADRFLHVAWRNRLNRWARLVNPLLKNRWLRGMEYRWVIDQAEYSTDVIFRSPQDLAQLYPRLLDHAAVNFSAQDMLAFLGRRLHPRFDGEVITECKKDRWPGARIKHRVKNNWLKMYDKFGVMLRIETVINQPREFKVRRARKRGGKRRMVWCPMNKGIANLYQYHATARAANLRYLEALSVVADPTASYQQVETLVRSRKVGERSYAGFNPACSEDVRLFQAVLRGEHQLRGFRNAEIRSQLLGESSCPHTRRRQSAAVGRRLKRLHVRGLIAKIPHARRWQVTALGHRVLGAIVRLYYHGLAQAA